MGTDPPDPPDATMLLNAAAAGDEAAANRFLPLVYEQLRAAAQAWLAGERAGHTLQATALVHEAYLKLAGPRELPWQNRAHFYTAAAQAMRQILIDHARGRGRVKRGGGCAPLNLDDGPTLGGPADIEQDFLALDEAIRRLEERDPRAAEVVRLRYFAGLSVEETALALGVSERTVKNDWAFSRAWLARELAV